MIALSTHSVFEGLAVGMSPNMNSLVSMMIAIVIHKGAAGISLGIALVKAFPNDFKLCRWLIFTFAMTSPVGIGIGMSIVNSSDVVDVVFSSLCAGTFVYIACSEIIVEEFSVPGSRFLNLCGFLIGTLVISTLWFLED